MSGNALKAFTNYNTKGLQSPYVKVGFCKVDNPLEIRAGIIAKMVDEK